MKEFADRLKKGEIDTSAYKEILQRIHDGIGPKRFNEFESEIRFLSLEEAAAKEPRLWEAYVRRFIAFYRLDTDQARKAWAHHEKCLDFVAESEKEHARDIKSLQGRVEVLSKTSILTADEANELAESRKRITHMQELRGKVFDDRLKPGLKKLPNDAQVKAAKERARDVEERLTKVSS
ncbi:MAG: hypothetical protein BroJett003_20330 [Planctomycetota bacterium]|nr:MAG: hypothetical protein BroJett003_20330 [Planctomycetota bacterium]